MLFFRDRKKGTGDIPVVRQFSRHGNDTLVRCPFCAEPTVIEGPDRHVFGKSLVHGCGHSFIVARDAEYDPSIE
jgi:hypothetical protein